MQEEFFIKHLTEKQILGPVLDVLTKAISRNNLLSSASLELFEYIKKENVKDLVKHLVESYRQRLLSLSYLSTFRDLVLRYDQTQGYTANMDYFLETDDEAGRKPPPGTRMMEHIAVDPVEDAYWEAQDPDDEDEELERTSGKTPAANGSSTPSRPLVDYPSDEEGDENADPNAQSPNGDESSESSGTVEGTETSLPTVPPPERLSEKRRREEDDEDELDKLIHNKRRNSSSSASNASVSSGMARRRKSFTAGSGNGTPKKISISLSPALKTGGNARSNEES